MLSLFFLIQFVKLCKGNKIENQSESFSSGLRKEMKSFFVALIAHYFDRSARWKYKTSKLLQLSGEKKSRPPTPLLNYSL